MSMFNQRGRGIGGIYNTLLGTIFPTDDGEEEKKKLTSLPKISKAISKAAKTSASKAGLKIEAADSLKKTLKVAKRKIATAFNHETNNDVQKLKQVKVKIDSEDKVTKKTKGRNTVDLFSEMFDENSK